jgi:hypothetical protein
MREQHVTLRIILSTSSQREHAEARGGRAGTKVITRVRILHAVQVRRFSPSALLLLRRRDPHLRAPCC